MKVVGLRINRDQKPYESTGDTMLALFDLEHAGLRLEECTLIWCKRLNVPLAQPPRLAGKGSSEHRRCHVIDREIHKAMSAVAYDAYLTFGGEPIASTSAA